MDPTEKALQICEDARAQLVLHHPFVGRLGTQIPFIAVRDSRIHTISTNGKVIYINPEWVVSMPPITMKGWIAHTIWTAALCHSFRRGDLEKGKFDLASDLEVYTLLCLENVPKAWKPDFHEMFPKHLPVEEIFKKLPDHKSCRYKNTDVHLYTGGVISLPENLPEEEKTSFPKEEKEKENGNGNGKGKGHQLKNDQKNKTEKKGGSDKEMDKGASSDPNSASDSGSGKNLSKEKEDLSHAERNEADCECDPSMREVWRQRIIEAGQNYKMVYGSLPESLAELVNFFAKGKTNRIQLLRRYLSLCTGEEAHWLPPARRFVWQGNYLPSHKDPKLEIVVAVDTSGSIGEEDFQKFFSEIVNTVNGFPNYKLTLIQCDCEIQDVQEFSKDKPFCRNTQITLKGRGGTDFTPVFEYITEKKIQPKVLLYYTDGCGDYPEKKPEYPIIWLLTAKASVPFGKKIIL